MRTLVLFTGLLVVVSAAVGQSVALAQSTQPSDKMIYLPLEQGGVDSGILFEAVSGDLHWVAGTFTTFSRMFNISSTGNAHLPAERVDDLVERFPTIFSLTDDPSTSKPSLEVDKGQLAEMLANNKSQLRKWLAKVQDTKIAELTKVSETWSDEDKSLARILVVMAGLHATEETAEAVAIELHARTNLPAYVFGYPNDAPIAESAELLVQHLSTEHRKYPDSKFTLVTHSMGGLVSRCAIEIGAIENGRIGAGITNSPGRSSAATRMGVDQLIQVCPPNHGSALAKYGPLLEGAEQVMRLVNRGAKRRSRVLMRAIVDGFNEAPADLDPNSEFLNALNKCGRDQKVKYSILAGSDGPLRSGVATFIGSVWERVSEAIDEPKELDLRVRDVLECAELQKGKGDGVVTIESAKLGGVSDFQVLKMHHLVWNELDSDPGKRMLDAVASRLGISL